MYTHTGDLHIGHALNKILKDFIVKHQLLRGKRVSYIPGWDCHGLPIELKVLQKLNSKEVLLPCNCLCNCNWQICN
jgi:isoleucyl-tRNA synthetase